LDHATVAAKIHTGSAIPGNRVRLPTFAAKLLEALQYREAITPVWRMHAKPLALLLSERGRNSNNGSMLDAPNPTTEISEKNSSLN
jgi:hypothetical protein